MNNHNLFYEDNYDIDNFLVSQTTPSNDYFSSICCSLKRAWLEDSSIKVA